MLVWSYWILSLLPFGDNIPKNKANISRAERWRVLMISVEFLDPAVPGASTWITF